jgi:hypothetical protein
MAIIDNATGDVENVILYDDEKPLEQQWPTPPGKTLVEDNPAERAIRGTPNPRANRWDGEKFVGKGRED